MSHTLDTASAQFLAELDDAVSRHAMLSHPFYRMWNEGRLDRDVLRSYAQQYFAHVRAFPGYVSAVHSQVEDLDLRQQLLENLIEEERGPENHPELWLRFAEALGADRDAVLGAELLDHTRESVARMKELTRGEWYEGLAALYAYESQIPEVAVTKRSGLKAFYGIDDSRATSFFTVHEAADVIHRSVERDALQAVASDPVARARTLAAAEAGAKALWHFLDGVQAAYVHEAC